MEEQNDFLVLAHQFTEDIVISHDENEEGNPDFQWRDFLGLGD